MKLNADIIYNNLKKSYNVSMSGPKKSELALSRPQFYMESDDVFLADHLYLATVEHLPARPRIQSGCVLICIGESFALKYYRERLCLITIKNRSDFFRAYHAIQEIFDFYDNWEKKMYLDLFSDYDIRTLINDSLLLFNKPIYVLDKSFRLIASTSSTSDPDWTLSDSGSLNYESVTKFLSASDLMLDQKNALKLEIYNNKVLCVNLYNKEDTYEGCLCIKLDNNDFTDGEDKLAEQLAYFIQLAIEKNPLVINDSQSTIKQVIMALVQELPLNYSQRIILNSTNNRTSYLCLYMRYRSNSNQLPLSYICDIFEDTFRKSFAFIYDNNIVCFVNVDELRIGNNDDYHIILNRKLQEFIASTSLRVGISNEFTDLFNVRIHYQQALSAMENGLLLDNEGTLFYFSSYALMEMIINSLGGLPAEAYFPKGFKSILEHDNASGVSYLETLRTFLEENMSYTTTAQKLFIHRSTLIDRISRIEKELGIDLKDSDKRLQLEILLKAIDLENILSKQ